MKINEFRIRFHWNMFVRFELMIFQHWFRQWLGAGQATSHCLNLWWLFYWRTYASLALNELTPVCPHSYMYSTCYLQSLQLQVQIDICSYPIMLLDLTQSRGAYEVTARHEGITGVTYFLQTYQNFCVVTGHDEPDRSKNVKTMFRMHKFYTLCKYRLSTPREGLSIFTGTKLIICCHTT